MVKKSSLILTTAGCLTLASARHISQCDFESGDCTGTYYPDINAAFVDCLDGNGDLMGRKEVFYTQPLQKVCSSANPFPLVGGVGSAGPMQNATAPDNSTLPADNSTVNVNNITMTPLNTTVVVDNSTSPADNSTMANTTQPDNSTDVVPVIVVGGNICDYYLNGEGYQFSHYEEGNQIGIVVLSDKIGTPTDVYYQNGGASTPSVPPTNGLNWNWAQLNELLAGAVNCNSASNSTMPASNSTGSVAPMDVSIYSALGLPWQQWALQALSSLNVQAWTKADYKTWIQNYITYLNALQSYIQSGEAAIQGVEDTANAFIGMEQSQIQAYVSQAQSIYSQASIFLQGTEASLNGSDAFTQFWQPNFDLDSVSIGDVVNDISLASNLVQQVEGWFYTFYYNGGVDAILGFDITYEITGSQGITNITAGQPNSGNVVVLPVPDNVESIVAWITSNFESELSSLLSQYNVTFTQGVVPVFVSQGAPLSASNYQLPGGCSYTNSEQDTIRCSAGNSRGVTFSFATINNFLSNQVQTVCRAASAAYASCSSNTVITNLATCLQLTAYNSFQLAQTTPIYGWLSYDSTSRNNIYNTCQSTQTNFPVSQTDFSSAFTFNFPNIN